MTVAEWESPVPSFVLGVHGVLRWHQWVVDSERRGGFPQPDEEAVFAVTNTRAEALGLVAYPTSPNPMARWSTEEAGGDWTQDGRVREIAWMQARPLNLAYQGWPVWPALGCIEDGLRRVGTVEPAGVHAALPLQLDTHHRQQFTGTYEWFELAEQAAARREFTVSLYTGGDGGVVPQALLRAITERASVLLDVQLAEQPVVGAVDPDQLEGRWMVDDELHGVHFRCRGPEWSLDMAAFVTDVVADAAKHAGVARPVLLTAFRAEDENRTAQVGCQ
ncbi:hypothetical protein [Actinopolyspora saharensis]|uniref:Uncharacterized protein n=1 Tax=Actinopolyspora saharensis TaxID=995062 RepID=A0A1H0YMR6_9ACTN|nr:hypothetical protein [Actinopolyspora saharensis]SDQ16492.1 hypothetical protein SAMN04489718_0565 [Actinopolyspora saharensis]